MIAPRSASAVLLVANYESDVGYAWWLMENFWRAIAANVGQQHRRCVLAYPKVRAIPQAIQTSPIEIVEFPFVYQSWRHVWRGLRFIREHKIRSVYLTDWPYLHYAYLLWRLAGVRAIVLHDHQPGDRPPATGIAAHIKTFMHSLHVLSATRYVAVSDYVKERLRLNARVPVERCVVVTNGIGLRERSARPRSEVRRRLGVPEDAVLIVLVSRATYYKGLDFAVHCVARLVSDRASNDCVYAVHCGDGPDLNAFADLAARLGVHEHFRFLGRRSDVWDILCASDIGFHPSNGEAMSLAILEFMAARLAVVTSNLPSVCTAVTAGATGLTYEHGSLEAAVDKLRFLIEKPAIRRALGEAAEAACRANYGLETMNEIFEQRVIPAF